MSEFKKQVQESFSKNPDSYVTSTTHKHQSDLDHVTEWLQPEPDWRVLDIATGGGHVAKELSRTTGTVFATDLTKAMLQNTAKHLRNHANIHYVIADAEELPFIDESFDAVTCRIAPHHFPNPDQFVKEAARVLKKNGRFLMIDNIAPENELLGSFYNTFEKRRDPSHVRALKISEWTRLLQNSSLSILKNLERKKTLPFRDWLERTADDPSQQHEVEQLFHKAPPETAEYFSFDAQLTSFTIDEWMVLAQKI